MLRPVLVEPPDNPPVTVEMMRAHSRVAFPDEDDAMLGALLDGAVSHFDGYSGVLGRCLVDQQWRQDYARWDGCLRLPFPDVSSASVTYRDETGAEQILAPVHYELVPHVGGPRVQMRRGFARPSLADAVAPVSVTFTAGFGADIDVPPALRVAISMLAAHWYEHREAVSEANLREVPMSVDRLIAPFRWRQV